MFYEFILQNEIKHLQYFSVLSFTLYYDNINGYIQCTCVYTCIEKNCVCACLETLQTNFYQLRYLEPSVISKILLSPATFEIPKFDGPTSSYSTHI